MRENRVVYLRFFADGKARYGLLGGKVISEITPDYFSDFRKTGKKYQLSKVRLLPPCQPSKVVAMGLNYLEHVKEMKMSIPLEPVIFIKPPSAVIGPGDDIVYPKSSGRVDFEGELAIVIKKKAKNVPFRRAGDYILGYTCLNDVTARDLQKTDGQWTRAKSFDTFAPLGPWIVDAVNPDNLKLETRVNGAVRQKANTNDLIFKIQEIVAFVSEVMTLAPGDVIATGTPPGVGPLKRGDTVSVKIEKIGTLTNSVA